MTELRDLYYSKYGHVETMARAVAEGAANVAAVEVAVMRVPELMPRDPTEAAGSKLDYSAPAAQPEELRRENFWNAYALWQHVRECAQYLPYGATMLADEGGSLEPSANGLEKITRRRQARSGADDSNGRLGGRLGGAFLGMRTQQVECLRRALAR
jgi:hypothetical protein